MNHEYSVKAPVSRVVFVFAAMIACALLIIVTAALIAIPAIKSIGILVAVICCFCSALLFSLVWPAMSWQWGVWLSAGFWLYFGFVFAAIAMKGELDWLPAINAICILVPACIGGIVGQRLSLRVRKRN